MKLEDEIKQSRPFESDAQRLTVNLLYTYNWLHTQMQAVFKSFGVTTQQYNALRILRGKHPDPHTIQDIKDRMLDKQSDVSRLVDRLIQKELVERKPNEVDRRKIHIRITQKGLDLLDEMKDSLVEFEKICSSLNKDEIRQLNDLLDRLRG